MSSKAKYLGRKRILPHNVTIEPKNVYDIEIIAPLFGYGVWQVLIKHPKRGMYLPYSDEIAIWDEWVPVSGSDDDEALR